MQPDVDKKKGRIFFGGKVYAVTKMPDGWVLTRGKNPDNLEILYTGDTIEDCCTWLTVQQA